jgi:hypothetical protein
MRRWTFGLHYQSRLKGNKIIIKSLTMTLHGTSSDDFSAVTILMRYSGLWHTYYCRRTPTFRRNMLIPSSNLNLKYITELTTASWWSLSCQMNPIHITPNIFYVPSNIPPFISRSIKRYNLQMYSDECRLWSYSLRNCLHLTVTSSVWVLNTLNCNGRR